MKKSLLCLSVACAIALSAVVCRPCQASDEAAAVPSAELILAKIKKHDKKVSRELRQIKRELAVMQQGADKPGFKDIVGGIGYILGIFGVAAYMAARKKGDS